MCIFFFPNHCAVGSSPGRPLDRTPPGGKMERKDAPKGTLTPESAMILALWYSCRFRQRTGPTAAEAAEVDVAVAAGRARRRSTLAAVDVSIVFYFSWGGRSCGVRSVLF